MRTRAALLFAALSLVAWALLAVCVPACSLFGAKTPERETARAAVVVASHAAGELSARCAVYVRATDDLELARKCAAGYDAARYALIATSSGVDAWESSEQARGSITCAVVHALAALEPAALELEGHGIPLHSLRDARRIASLLGSCAEDRP